MTSHGRPVVPAAGRRRPRSRADRQPRPSRTSTRTDPPRATVSSTWPTPVRSTSRNSTQPVRRPRVTSRASPASRVRSANVTSSRSSWSIARTHCVEPARRDGLAVDVDLDHERQVRRRRSRVQLVPAGLDDEPAARDVPDRERVGGDVEVDDRASARAPAGRVGARRAGGAAPATGAPGPPRRPGPARRRAGRPCCGRSPGPTRPIASIAVVRHGGVAQAVPERPPGGPGRVPVREPAADDVVVEQVTGVLLGLGPGLRQPAVRLGVAAAARRPRPWPSSWPPCAVHTTAAASSPSAPRTYG